jgi:hypothetical protein
MPQGGEVPAKDAEKERTRYPTDLLLRYPVRSTASAILWLAPTSQRRPPPAPILRSSRRAAALHLSPQSVGISQFRSMKFPRMLRVFDHAAFPHLSPCRSAGCCLPPRLTASALRVCVFRGSIPRLRLPLSTLRCSPRGLHRMTRGQNDWLGLFCATLSFATSCSLSGASKRHAKRLAVSY